MSWRKILRGVLGLLALAIVVSMFPVFGVKRLNRFQSSFAEQPPYRFPKDFVWGTATAAQQIEHQQNSDWSAFEKGVLKHQRFGQISQGVAKPGHIHNLGNYPKAAVAQKADFDGRFASDLAMAAKMGHQAFRFSFSWSRLFPREEMTTPDPAGIQFYQKLLNTLKRLKIKPSGTLFHFSSPAWLWKKKAGKRGWERPDALQHFERFVKAVAHHFGGQITHWCTLNEPMVYVYNGYLEGVFPPNERRGDPSKAADVIAQLLRAHAMAYHVLKTDAKRRKIVNQVGIAKHTRGFEPYRNYAPLDRITAGFIQQAFLWDFLDAIHTGTFTLTNSDYKREIKGLRGSQDYIGINYYGRFYVRSNLLKPTKFKIMMRDKRDKRELANDLGWALYPHGLFLVLSEAHRRYQKPIYILENGLADKADNDKLRQHFLVTHLREIWHAIKHAKVDVRGYFHWTLTDNFEWAEGFEARFGLIKIDFKKGFTRTLRPSAGTYSAIIRANAISPALWKKHRSLPPTSR